MDLKSGYNLLPLSGLKIGTQIRVRTEMEATDWAASPRVGSYVLASKGVSLRWVTSAQWQLGSGDGAIKIEE